MVRKALPAIIVALFLVASAAPFLTTINSDEQNLAGDPPTSFDPSWIPISTPEELALIGSGGGGAYPVNGKYYLTDDIDFTDGTDLNGGFDITVTVTIGSPMADKVLVSLNYGGTTTGITSGQKMMVSLNDDVREIDIGFSEALFNMPADTSVLEVVAGGTAGNPPVGTTPLNFAVAASFTFVEESEASKTVKSNGNMNPLTPVTGFSGTFDGNGKKIIGLEISSYTTTGSTYVGLFGSLRTNTVSLKNIALEGGSTVSVSTATVHLGGIAGCSENTVTVTNSYNTGNVSTISRGYTLAGGLFGSIGTSSMITGSHNTGNVKAFSFKTPVSGSNSMYAGGLVGSTGNQTTITNCFNEGVISSNIGGSYNSYSGGLVANSGSLTITESHNTGNVTAKVHAGGLLGTSISAVNITGCYNTGVVSADLIDGTAVSIVAGGLVASAGGAVGNPSTITDSCNTGVISTSGSTSGIVAAGGLAGSIGVNTIKRSYNAGEITSGGAGGLIGEANGTDMRNSYNTGNVNAAAVAGGLIATMRGSAGPALIADCYVTGDIEVNTISLSGQAGGLIGYTNLETEMTRCYTTGNITASGTSYMYAGGLVGDTFNRTVLRINECYTEGNVTATSSTTATTVSPPYANAGGLIGTDRGIVTVLNAYVRGDISATVTSASLKASAGGIIGSIQGSSGNIPLTILTNCYVTGAITSSTSDIGGIVGIMAGHSLADKIEEKTNIVNCYFLEDVGLNIHAGTISPILDGDSEYVRSDQPSGSLTDVELKDKTSYYSVANPNTWVELKAFKGWDFETIWNIDVTEVINDGYPFFRWAIFAEHPKDITVNIIPNNEFRISTHYASDGLQWQKSTDGIVWTNITENGNGLVYKTTASDNFDEMFRCLVGPIPSNSARILGFDLTINITGTGELQYGGGDISSNTVITNVPTKEIEFTVDPGDGYCLDSITLGGTDITATLDEYNKFTVDTTASHTLTVVFVLLPEYTITVDVNDPLGGSVSPDGEVSVTHGNDLDITITTTTGYWHDFTIDGKYSHEWESGTYDFNYLEDGTLTFTLKNVTGDHEVLVIFEKKKFDVETYIHGVDEGLGGTISPNWPEVSYGDDVPFTIIPNSGYRIKYVEVGDYGYSAYTGGGDGRMIDISTEIVDNVYVMTNVRGSYWIVVYFEEIPDVVTTSVRSGNGTITPTVPTEVTTEDKKISIGITPDAGWTIYRVYVNDELSYQWQLGIPFQLIITEDTLVEVVFLDRFTIDASVDGTGGTISPSGGVEVLLGADKKFTITPNLGYFIEGILVDNEDVEVASEYLFESVDDFHSIVVIFAAFEYYIFIEGYDEAKVELNIDPVLVTIEDIVTVTLTPFKGYEATITGVDVGTLTYNDSDRCWEIRDINANCTITMSIVPLVYHITVDEDYDDTIVTLVDITETEVTIETTVDVTLVVIEGYSATISVDVGTLTYNDSDRCWIITDINADCTITVLINKNEEPGSGINLLWIVVIIIIAVAAGIVVYVSRKKK